MSGHFAFEARRHGETWDSAAAKSAVGTTATPSTRLHDAEGGFTKP
jgi:hypothetical protein